MRRWRRRLTLEGGAMPLTGPRRTGRRVERSYPQERAENRWRGAPAS